LRKHRIKNHRITSKPVVNRINAINAVLLESMKTLENK
jgi:hypothetical protein